MLGQSCDRTLSAVFFPGECDRYDFIVLLTGFLKIEHVQEKADFLLGNMAFFFVPAGVSIINYFDILKSTVLQLLVICVVSTIVTFAVTAYAVTLTVKLKEKKKGGKKA